ncbi:MAG: type II secretion system F family protein [Egibacteraceae bacterium]
MSSVGGLLLALLAAYGVYLLYTSVTLGWRGLGISPGIGRIRPRRRTVAERMARLGLADVRPAELAAGTAVLAVVGAGLGYALFGGLLPALAAAVGVASGPVTAARARTERRRLLAAEAWPRMIEELRLQTGSLGRSVPQALLEVGLRGPQEYRAAFLSAHREWVLSTDFDRTLALLKKRLADPTADVVCETLLIAYELGGTDLDRRLRALVEDRISDVQGRKDALAEQAGARFARRFVLVVPLGMAVAGLAIGNGRAAYATGAGQLAALLGLLLMAGCWWWAGRILRLPTGERVFS